MWSVMADGLSKQVVLLGMWSLLPSDLSGRQPFQAGGISRHVVFHSRWLF